MEKPVIKIIEEVAEEFCNNYCKYVDSWNKEDGDLFESDTCKNCPFNKLI